MEEGTSSTREDNLNAHETYCLPIIYQILFVCLSYFVERIKVSLVCTKCTLDSLSSIAAAEFSCHIHWLVS